MEMWIEACPLEEWALHAIEITGFQGTTDAFIAANAFSCMQFIEEEIVERKRHQAFRLILSRNKEEQAVAWLSIYYISDHVLRLRGLYVNPEYRGRGLMSYFIKEILQKFRGLAQKVLSFSRPSSIDFHLKNGFQIEHRFVPRQTAQKNVDETLTLMFYDLGGSSARS